MSCCNIPRISLSNVSCCSSTPEVKNPYYLKESKVKEDNSDIDKIYKLLGSNQTNNLQLGLELIKNQGFKKEDLFVAFICDGKIIKKSFAYGLDNERGKGATYYEITTTKDNFKHLFSDVANLHKKIFHCAYVTVGGFSVMQLSFKIFKQTNYCKHLGVKRKDQITIKATLQENHSIELH